MNLSRWMNNLYEREHKLCSSKYYKLYLVPFFDMDTFFFYSWTNNVILCIIEQNGNVFFKLKEYRRL